MLRPTIVSLLLISSNSAVARGNEQPVDRAELARAAEKAMKPIQKSQSGWYDKAACTSCHHHNLPELMFSVARERGIAFDAAAARDFSARSFAYLKDLDAIVQGYDYIDEVDDASRLVAAHAAGIKPNLSTDVAARAIASLQRPDGGWYTMDTRPPQSHGPFTITAMCARAVGLYMPGSFENEKETVLRRAREWFLKTEPRTTEDRTFHLLGLLWTGADDAARKSAAERLLLDQRGDGGWAQLRSLESDAYATGQVLVALHRAGAVATNNAAFQKGLRFLLRTQKPDGSWRVESRIHPAGRGSPQYFDAGFPNGRYHQYISIMGTTWAATALMQAIPPQPGARQPALPDLAPGVNDEWVRTALNGSVDELRKALDGGMKANARTARGTTALMFAARDPAKVKLLLERGADASARAESGFDALIVAARSRGNSESVRLLLKHGARANPPAGVRVKNDSSALFFASAAGDVDMVRALIESGARIEDTMQVLGQFPATPLLAAAFRGDAAMAEHLIARGAKADRADKDENTPLDIAVIGNRAEVVKLLVAKGAKVNHVDKFGFTPLIYAVSVDYGDTTVIEALLAAGADVNAKDAEGRSALDLAGLYKHDAMEKVLKRSAAGKP